VMMISGQPNREIQLVNSVRQTVSAGIVSKG
jgi:hypothetical protein